MGPVLAALLEVAICKIIEEVADRAEAGKPIPRSKISQALRNLKDTLHNSNLTAEQKVEVITKVGEILAPLYEEI